MIGLIVAIAAIFGAMVGAAFYFGLLLILLMFRAVTIGATLVLGRLVHDPPPR